MPLKPIAELMADARNGGYALGYFESWNLESLQGVLDAAEQTRSPILIGFNGGFLSRSDRLADERISWYAALGRAAAESASVPCGLVFNECAQDDRIRLAVESGFGQAMLDDPDATHEQYARRVKDLADFAHDCGAAFEAEVGELPHFFNGSASARGGSLTDVEAAGRFVQETGVDLLAVSVGNVHASPGQQRDLDIDRLAAIRKRVGVPLDLHGGSGISEGALRDAISVGVAKVCYGTYVKQRYAAGLRRALADDQADVHRLFGYGGREDVLVAGRHAVRDAVLERLCLLGCCGRA